MKYYINKRFLLLSSLLLVFIYIMTTTVYVLAVRQINQTYVRQQLVVSGETIKLNVAQEITSELSLIMKIASSPIIQQFMLNPDDPIIRYYALSELEMFEEHIKTGIAFWINDIDRMFHFTGFDPYYVDIEDEVNYWYKMTLYETEDYNFNINYNPDLDMINLWVNAPIFAVVDGTRKPVGLIGTGINLTQVIEVVERSHRERSRYITAFFFNQYREITCAADFELVKNKVNIVDHLGEAGIEIVRVADSIVDGKGQNYIHDGYMYRVGIVPAIKGWNIAMRYPLPGWLALNQEINYVFFSMLALIFVLFVVMNVMVTRSESATRKQNIQLLEANRQAENASKTKSNFLATMSHEIRTPLNAIIGIAQMQLQDKDIPEKYVEAFEKTYSSGTSLLGIINDILDLSKIETGKMELTNAEYDLPGLIQDTVQMNIVRIGEKPIDFIVNADKTLPGRLIGDELRLKQIINNVLSNAVKYTKEGRIKFTISHENKGSDHLYLKFSVEDTGQGMKKEDKMKLFTEYSRFNAENNQFIEGTGLGLNITKSIVELMEGNITVESEYGVGSTFTIIVKQHVVECEPIGKLISTQLKNFNYETSKKDVKTTERCIMPYGKILVVDDVDTNLYVAEGLLSPYQLKIVTARSGFEAIDIIEKMGEFDIIFMDHMMPEMDGIETTKKLRQNGYSGTIIALTANALVGNDDMFKQNGLDDFISKPIDINQLDNALNKYIRDKYPEEAAKYVNRHCAEGNDEAIHLNPKLLEIFRQDAVKAVKTLNESFESGNISLFTTTVHAMKSALANIGKTEESGWAGDLEEAGRKNDTQYISSNLGRLIDTLEILINEYAPSESESDDADIIEDTAYLNEELNLIKTACEEYDDKTLFASLERLKEKQWKNETHQNLNKIHDLIYFESDFDKAIELIDHLNNP